MATRRGRADKKKQLISYYPLCILIVMSLCFGQGTYGKSLLKNAIPIITYEYPPYTSRLLESGGMRTEIIKAAYSNVGHEAEVILYPTKRAQQLFLESPSLGYMGIMSHFSQREQEDFLFVRLMPIRLAIFYYSPTYPNGITFEKAEDLQAYSVGTMLGSVTAKKLRKAQVEVQEQTNLDGLIKKLRAKRIDFAAMTDLFGVQTSIRLFPDEHENFKQLPNALMEAWIGLMFHKSDPKAPKRAEYFALGMQHIMVSGTYLTIIKSYYQNGKVPDNIINFIEEKKRIKGNKKLY